MNYVGPTVHIKYSGSNAAQPAIGGPAQIPSRKELPKLTITPQGFSIENGQIESLTINPRGRFTARIRTINDEICLIRGRIKSGDIRPEKAAEELDRAENLQREADETASQVNTNDEEYHEVAKGTAEIHLGAVEVAGHASGLMGSANNEQTNTNIAERSVRLIKRAHNFRLSGHFGFLKREGYEIANKLEARIAEVSQKLAAKMQELGIAVDPLLLSIAAGSEEANTAGAESTGTEQSAVTAGTTETYQSANEALELVLQIIYDQREHAEKTKETLAENKEELKAEEKLLEKKQFEKKCAGMLALLKQIYQSGDPEKAKKLMITLVSTLNSVLAQLAQSKEDLPPRSLVVIESFLAKLKGRVDSLSEPAQA